MFLEHFKLSVQLLGITPDARFLYLSQTHRETSGGSDGFLIANVPASQVGRARKRTDEKTPPQPSPTSGKLRWRRKKNMSSLNPLHKWRNREQGQ